MTHSCRDTIYHGLDRQPIGGIWRHGRGDGVIADRDPFTGEVLLEIPSASVADLDAAFAAAARAQPAWAAAMPADRAAVLRRVAGIMETARDEIIDWLIRESGSTRIKAAIEWSSVRAVALHAAAMPYHVEGRILPADVPGKECRVYRRPVGVIGVISPWDWPMRITARSLFPALAVGNAVVVKPASDTPVTGGILLAKMLEEAGLPPGVLSVVVASSQVIGDAFVTHPVPRVISFTGTTAIGRQVAAQAAQATSLKRLELELGGNGAFVVLEDADVERAVAAAVFGRFLHQGQMRMSANRLIVHQALYDAFLHRFVERVKALPVGDPSRPETVIGPVINQAHLDRLLQYIEQARADGLPQLAGGPPRGLVLPPHVFAEVANDNALAQHELFGPIAPVIRVRDEADALSAADATQKGLSASVFTRDLERGARFARRLDIGMVHVNDHPLNELPNNPFGGEKNSGTGRFGGAWAIDAFTTDQWVTLQQTPRTYPF
jgi:aldehyde dehydrogenase (NAD+)